MTAFTQALLTTYLNTDPNSLGLAPLIASISGNVNQNQIQVVCQEIANLINTGSGTSISATYITKNNMIFGTLSIGIIINQGAGAIGADGVHTITAVVVARWNAVLNGFYHLDDGTQIQFALFNTLSLNAVGDNVLTEAQATALAQETNATWAEVQWGQGTVVSASQVQAALGH